MNDWKGHRGCIAVAVPNKLTVQCALYSYRTAQLARFNTPEPSKHCLPRSSKCHPECTKIRHFELQIEKKILGRGHGPLSRPLPSGEGEIPSPRPTPLGAFGASILAPSALDLGASTLRSATSSILLLPLVLAHRLSPYTPYLRQLRHD